MSKLQNLVLRIEKTYQNCPLEIKRLEDTFCCSEKKIKKNFSILYFVNIIISMNSLAQHEQLVHIEVEPYMTFQYNEILSSY